MAISVDWPSGVITVYQADMVPLGGSVYELDVNQLYLDLKRLEYLPEEGMAWPDTHKHNPPYTVSGQTFAPSLEIINGYTVTISPAGAYQVSCTGANHNLADVYNNLTGPTLLPNLSGGLIIKESAVSGLTQEESDALIGIEQDVDLLQTDVAQMQTDVSAIEGNVNTISAAIVAIQGDIATIQTNVGYIQTDLAVARKVLQNRKETNPLTGTMTVYDDDDSTPLLTAQLWANVEGTVPYTGQGLERQDRLT